MREGDHLNPAVVFHLLAGEQQTARGAQSPNSSNVAEQPKEYGAVLDALLEGARGACGHFYGVVVALEIVGDLDRLGERAGNVRPHDVPQEAFVRMVMQVEQTRQNQIAAGIDFVGGAAWKIDRNGGNLFPLDCDIDGFLLVPHAGVTDDQTHDPVLMLVLLRGRLRLPFPQPPSCSLENMQPARAVDQVNEAAVVEAHVVALHPRCPRWNVRYE